MKLEYRKPSDSDFLCDYYRIHELSGVNELLSELLKKESENSDFQFLITLDEIGQADYTSMHAKHLYELDYGDWLSKEDIDPSWLDHDGDLREDLNFDQQLKIRQLGFKHGLANTNYENIFEKGLSLNDNDKKLLIQANQNITSILDLDDGVYLLKTPVKVAYESIYSFPNGYFAFDLSPFENYHLAKHLEINFGLTLLGLGASYIAFRKRQSFDNCNIVKILEIISKLYQIENDHEFLNFFKEHLYANEILVLKYTEQS